MMVSTMPSYGYVGGGGPKGICSGPCCMQCLVIAAIALIYYIVLSLVAYGRPWPTCPTTMPSPNDHCFGLLLDCQLPEGSVSCFFIGYWYQGFFAPVAGRPYMVGGRSLQATCNASSPTAAALPPTSPCPAAWGGAGDAMSLSGPCAERPGNLAELLVAEGIRSAGAAAPWLPSGLDGTLALGDELPQLLATARQELAAAKPDELEGWRKAGLAEHAAIGAFAKLGLELLVAGAPPRLMRLAARAQEEEALHAHISLALSGGSPEGLPLDFPEHSLDLRRDHAALHKASVHEGIEGEGHAALDLFGKASAALHPDAGRPALGRLAWAMARDEARHAALAEDTLHWLHESKGMQRPDVEVFERRVRVQWPQVV